MIGFIFTQIAISPNYSRDKTIFAATNDEGVFKSINSSNSWKQINSGIEFRNADLLTISPNFSRDKTLFVVISEPISDEPSAPILYKSTNGGKDWKKVKGKAANLWPIVYSPTYAKDKTMFALRDGFYKSMDRGQHWEKIPTPFDYRYLSSYVVSPNYVKDKTLFAVVKNKKYFDLHKSTDGGNHWIKVKSQIATYENNYVIPKLTISPDYANDSTLIISDYSVRKSTDGGINWSQIYGSLSNEPISDIVISPEFGSDQTMFIHNIDIFESTDAGLSWYIVKKYSYYESVFSIIFSPNYAKDKTIFIVDGINGVLKSTTKGAKWTSKNKGFSIGTYFSDVIARPSEVTAGQNVTIRGNLWTSDGYGLGDKRIMLKANGITVARARTNLSDFKFVHKPKKNTTYQVIFNGGSGYRGTKSQEIKVKVRRW